MLSLNPAVDLSQLATSSAKKVLAAAAEAMAEEVEGHAASPREGAEGEAASKGPRWLGCQPGGQGSLGMGGLLPGRTWNEKLFVCFGGRSTGTQ
jgi:hypothetical protein